MSETDDDTSSYQSGYVTPPLSPTKTISTEGWFSPRTPESLHRSRSHLHTRQGEYDRETPFSTPPASPTKPRFTVSLGALASPELCYARREAPAPQFEDGPPKKQSVSLNDDKASTPWLSAVTSTHSRSSDDLNGQPNEPANFTDTAIHAIPFKSASQLQSRRISRRSFSDSLLSVTDTVTPETSHEPETIRNGNVGREHLFCGITTPVGKGSLPAELCQFPLRHASSPLRPSQWVARGGLLQSPRRRQSCTPDRFIACRRPPVVTRESFELNKPAERLERAQVARSSRPSGDPFSRRLRRSGRLNEELRGLREAHSMIMSRASAHRRNASLAYRRNSYTLGTRQVSAGAVWNVGGPSAVSDTVVAVSNGRGGMLGSGTNAPLYASTFLNRADPEAELEAYECRIALALDVDQTERILQHTPMLATSHSASHGGGSSHGRHIWRDSAWTEDYVSPRLSSSVSNFTQSPR